MSDLLEKLRSAGVGEPALRASGLLGHAQGLNQRQAIPKAGPNPNIRQRRRGGPSKLQLEWLERLRLLHPAPQMVLDEWITLSLGNGVTYRPDVWLIQPVAIPDAPWTLFRLEAHEVKGQQYWAAARVKNKVAARTFPWIKFYLVTRLGKWSKEWKQEQILP